MIFTIVKIASFVAGLVGIFAQAKGRGASTVEAVAETAAGVVTGAAGIHMAQPAYAKPKK